MQSNWFDNYENAASIYIPMHVKFKVFFRVHTFVNSSQVSPTTILLIKILDLTLVIVVFKIFMYYRYKNIAFKVTLLINISGKNSKRK